MKTPVLWREYHLRRGTTGLCCTLYRDLGADGILAAEKKVKDAMANTPSILGVHLEGPYLNPRYGSKPSDNPLVAAREAARMPAAGNGNCASCDLCAGGRGNGRLSCRFTLPGDCRFDRTQ